MQFKIPWDDQDRFVGEIGLGYRLRPLQHDFYHLEQCEGKCNYLDGILGYFRAVIGAPGDQDFEV